MGRWDMEHQTNYEDKRARVLQTAINKRDHGLPLNRAERRALKKWERWWK